MWILFAFLSAIFAGLTAVLAKIGLKDTDSNLATAMRTVVVLTFSLILVFSTGAIWQLGQVTLSGLVFLILSGVGTGLSWLCYFRALQIGDVNKVVPIDRSSTLLTMIFAMIFLGETDFMGVRLLGMALIAAGTALMLLRDKPDAPPADRLREKIAQNRKGLKARALGSWWVFAVLAAVFAAMTAILSKMGMENIDSNLGTTVRTAVVLVMAWGIVFMQNKQGEIKSLSPKGWLFIVLSGMATGLSWLCYYRALQTGQASVVVPIDKLSIVITVLFSTVILKEKMSKKAWIGLGVLTLGTLVLLIQW